MADFIQKAKEIAGLAMDASAELYKAAEEKTRIFAKKAKIKTEIAMANTTLKNMYAQIGKMYFDSHENSPGTGFEQAFEGVKIVKSGIAAKVEELERLKLSQNRAVGEDDDADDADIEFEVKFESYRPEATDAQDTGKSDESSSDFKF